jgi:hypothetical protein
MIAPAKIGTTALQPKRASFNMYSGVKIFEVRLELRFISTIHCGWLMVDVG